MSLEVLRAGIRWDFETMPQYLDMLERRGAALNVAAFVGHSSIRTVRHGRRSQRARRDRRRDPEMQALVLEALRAGRSASPPALRPRTTARAESPCPRASPTRPRCARWSAACARRARRLHADQGRADGDRLPRGARRRRAAPGRDCRAASQHESRRRVPGPAENPEANERGRRLVGAVSCCPLAMDFTLHSPYVFEGLEAWRPALGLKGKISARAKLGNRQFRDAVRNELARPAHFRLFNGEWQQVHVIQSARKSSSSDRSASSPQRPAPIRSTSCSTSRWRRTSTRSTARFS